jgi:hypothetical protein
MKVLRKVGVAMTLVGALGRMRRAIPRTAEARNILLGATCGAVITRSRLLETTVEKRTANHVAARSILAP